MIEKYRKKNSAHANRRLYGGSPIKAEFHGRVQNGKISRRVEEKDKVSGDRGMTNLGRGITKKKKQGERRDIRENLRVEERKRRIVAEGQIRGGGRHKNRKKRNRTERKERAAYMVDTVMI